MDAWIVLSVVASYGFFIMTHLLMFRFARPQEVLKSLMQVGFLTIGWHLICLYVIYGKFIGDLGVGSNSFPSGWLAVVVGAGFSFVILGLLMFVHVLCLFGPYETSIRLRLVRELYRGRREGMTLEDILKNYNAKTILEKRLSRLTASGELIQETTTRTFQINKHINIFFFIDFIVGHLQRIIAVSKDTVCSND